MGKGKLSAFGGISREVLVAPDGPGDGAHAVEMIAMCRIGHANLYRCGREAAERDVRPPVRKPGRRGQRSWSFLPLPTRWSNGRMKNPVGSARKRRLSRPVLIHRMDGRPVIGSAATVPTPRSTRQARSMPSVSPSLGSWPSSADRSRAVNASSARERVPASFADRSLRIQSGMCATTWATTDDS